MEQTRPYLLQVDDISTYKEIRPPPVVADDGNLEFLMKEILSHRKRGRVLKFTMVIMGETRQEIT